MSKSGISSPRLRRTVAGFDPYDDPFHPGGRVRWGAGRTGRILHRPCRYETASGPGSRFHGIFPAWCSGRISVENGKTKVSMAGRGFFCIHFLLMGAAFQVCQAPPGVERDGFLVPEPGSRSRSCRNLRRGTGNSRFGRFCALRRSILELY